CEDPNRMGWGRIERSCPRNSRKVRSFNCDSSTWLWEWWAQLAGRSSTGRGGIGQSRRCQRHSLRADCEVPERRQTYRRREAYPGPCFGGGDGTSLCSIGDRVLDSRSAEVGVVPRAWCNAVWIDGGTQFQVPSPQV